MDDGRRNLASQSGRTTSAAKANSDSVNREEFTLVVENVDEIKQMLSSLITEEGEIKLRPGSAHPGPAGNNEPGTLS